MSDHFTIFVPVDPRFVPAQAGQGSAASLLQQVEPAADEIRLQAEDRVIFRDCGENFERVRCPACGEEIDVGTWQEWMSADYDEDGGFGLVPVPLPCCGRAATLDELDYEAPQAFSRFALTAKNFAGHPPPDLIAQLETALGCRLRVVHQHL